MIFSIDMMKKYGLKWIRIKDCTAGVIKYKNKPEDRRYFYFYLNADSTVLHMGFYTREQYDAVVHNPMYGPNMNEIVISNPKLPEFLVKQEFFELLYDRYMEIYGDFYDAYVQGDMYSGIISTGGRHYHYLADEKLGGGYEYFIEEIKKPEKPYMPYANCRRQIERLNFVNDFLKLL